MRRALFIIFFFLPMAFAAAQAVSTRDNYTGFWTDRASWNQNWAGIANPTPLPVAQISLYGYVSVGRKGAAASIELPASASSTLTVYDTLRIYGNLIVGNSAHLIVEATGVLIIHGYYNQFTTGSLTNKGKIIALGDFSISNSTTTTSNTGSIYVGGKISPGARTYTSKTLATLKTEDPVTSYFSTTDVIDSHCKGNNSGRLTFSGTASVVRWESSTDYFKRDIKHIANTTAELSYSNLLRTTSYRVYYDAGGGTFDYSTGGTLFVTDPPLAGQVSGPTEFCQWISSATFTLANHTGSIKQWEWGYDDFITAPQVVVSTSNTLTLTNLTQDAYVRAVITGCSDVYTASFKVKVIHPSVGGTVLSPVTVCAGTNSGTLQVQNSNGAVLRWESSTDGFKTVNTIANTTTSLTYTNLTVNTAYRAVISSASVCPEAFSNAAEVKVIQSLNESTLAVAGIQAPANGLLAHYPFIKNANDASGNGNHGIAHGVTPTTDRFGRVNNAYSFDGVDDVISTSIPFSAPGPNTFTLSVWFRTTSTRGGRLLGSGSSQFGGSPNYDRQLYLSNTGQLYFGIYQTDKYPDGNKVVATTQSYNDGGWHHAVATLSAAGMKLYVDGVLRVSDTRYTYAEGYSGYWKVGFDNLSGWPATPASNYYAGALDDIFIYNRELTATEITQLYGGTAGPFCVGTNVQLRAAAVPGATYAWSGPGGFTATQQNPLLTAIQPAQAGTYTVTISLNGCAYTGSVAVVVPLEGIAVASLSQVCSGTNSGSLRLESYSGDILQWESSTDNFVSNKVVVANTTAELLFQNLTATTSYRALVRRGTCGNAYSGTASVQVVQPSLGGTISGTSQVCKGTNSGSLSLAGHRGDIQYWQYSDDGLVPHSQSIANTTASLTFSNLTADRWYRAVVQNGSCALAYSPFFKVTVSELVAGTLSGNAAVCQGETSGLLTLQGYTGTIRRWESSTDNFAANVVAISHTAATYTSASLTADTWYRVVVGNTTCADVVSIAWKVTVTQPSLGGDLLGAASFCSTQNTGTLQLQNHLGSIVRWEASTDGFALNLQAIANTSTSYTFSNLTATTTYRAVVKNGDCAEAYSATATIIIAAPAQAGAVSGAATVCPGENSGTLILQSKTGEVVRWESSTDGFATVVSMANTSDNLSYQNLTATTNFRAVVQNGSCDPVYSQTATITVAPATTAGSVAGSRAVVSGTNEGSLLLQGQGGQILYWQSSTDNFASQVEQVTNTTHTQSYLNLGQTTWYRAVVQNESCLPVYSAAAQIRVNHAPLAQVDTILVQEANYTSSISVLLNDSDPDDDPIRVVPAQLQTAANGSVSIDEKGVFHYEAPKEFYGYDSFTYTVCDGVPEATLCDEATVVLDLALSLVVYQGVSPNNDGDNDFWYIGFIERYPENKVQLYDRQGALVFEQMGYNNQDRKFAGLSNKGMRPGGNELPDGTYYYKITTTGKAPVLQGYIILKK